MGTSSPVLTVTTSTTDGLIFNTTNPFSDTGHRVTYNVYVDTDAANIPPTKTAATALMSTTTDDWLRARFFWRGGTAATTYVAVITATDTTTSETVTSNVVTGIVFPTGVATSPDNFVFPSKFNVAVGNDGSVVLAEDNNGDLVISGGNGFNTTGVGTGFFVNRCSSMSGYNDSGIGGGFSNAVAYITTFPWKDTSTNPGSTYYYAVQSQDENFDNQAKVINNGKNPAVIPSVGEVAPLPPSIQLFLDTTSFWLYITDDESAQGVYEYDIYLWGNYLKTVSKNDGPWYQCTTGSDGSAFGSGSYASWKVKARNYFGTSDLSSNSDATLSATQPDLNASLSGTMSTTVTRSSVLTGAISGGKLPYKSMTLYIGSPTTPATQDNAIVTIDNFVLGITRFTTSPIGNNVLLVVEDAAGTIATSGSFNVTDQGQYNPGDMSEYIEEWSSNLDEISIAKPSTIRRVMLSGSVPSNVGDTTTVHLTMLEGTTSLFDASAKISIQGQTSTGAVNKGYKVKLTNKDTNDKLKIKFGSWYPDSTFDLKSYGYSDDTGLRDMLCFTLWGRVDQAYTGYPEVLGFPKSQLGTWTSPLDTYGEASMTLDGFPVEMYLNGVYMGLYNWRQTVTPEIYQMDDSLNTNILLKYDHSGGTGNGEVVNLIDWGTFVPANWSMVSPVIAGYSDQSALQTVAPTVYTAANAVFTALGAYQTSQTADTLAAVEAVLDKERTIDYVLFSNAVTNTDGYDDNLMFASWDGKTFAPLPYDLDLTLGNQMTENDNYATTIQVSGGIWMVVEQAWKTEACARWKYLRDTKVFHIDTMVEDIRTRSAMIGARSRARMHALYGQSGQSTYTDDSIAMLLDGYVARLTLMDAHYSYVPQGVTFY